MKYQQILRYQPWLRFVNFHDVSSNLLETTRGDAFVAYNTLTGNYELHSVKSFMISGYSHNANIPKEFINGYLYSDFRANSHAKYGIDIEDMRKAKQLLYENTRQPKADDAMKTILERTLGTKL